MLLKLFQKRLLWHKKFIQALVAGLGLALTTFFFNFSLPEIILFSSVGGSAIILAHEDAHHLTKLHTILYSYFLAAASAVFITMIKNQIGFSYELGLFLTVFLSSFLTLFFNVVHPPAISAAFSFFYFDMGAADLGFLFLFVAIIFIIIRFATYLFHHKLNMETFYEEFINTLR